MQLDRPLDPLELRVLGSLLEKQQATPDLYPLTLNAIAAACNQKTNRDPVMDLGEDDLRGALQRLQELNLVWEIHGGRALRYDHRLDGRWGLTQKTKALISILFLRGPQTAGELRNRSERLARFDSIEDVEGELRFLGKGNEPLVRELPRRPGQKENRWVHLAGDVTPDDSPEPHPRASSSMAERIERLESDVAELRAQLEELRHSLGD
ncbi:MAG TPA: YceH family protein [Thermoanaerobaculia bacterium]|nr:YceH family protein [Thermoanaerobaculia bacterium]